MTTGAPAPERTAPGGRVAVAVALGAVLVVYGWPLLDGSTGPGVRLLDAVARGLAAAALVVVALVPVARRGVRIGPARVTVAVAGGLAAAAQSAVAGRPGTPGAAVVHAAGAAVLGTGLLAVTVLRTRPRDRLEGLAVAGNGVVAGSAAALLVLAVRGALSAVLPPGVLAAVVLGAGAAAAPAAAAAVADADLARLGLALVAVGEGALAALLPAGPPAVRVTGAAATAGVVLLALTAGRPSGHPRPPRGPAADVPAAGLVVTAAVLLAWSAVPGVRRPAVAVLLALTAAACAARLVLASALNRRRLADLEREQERLLHASLRDELTGVANRQLFLDRLEQALSSRHRHLLDLAVLYCDLDGFKRVNDSHGHGVGDEVLQEAARRLASCLRPTDTLARLGGDEFGVLLEAGADPAPVVQRMRERIAAPLGVAGGTVSVDVSIGVAVLRPDEPVVPAAVLLARADADMYADKHGRRRLGDRSGRVVELDGAARREELTAVVQRLLAGHVGVVFQPLVDARTGRVRYLEARARLSGRGATPADGAALVALVEEAGLGWRLTTLVLEAAAEQVHRWRRQGGDDVGVLVRLTDGEAHDPELPARIADVVARSGVPAGSLVLETTAAALAGDPAASVASAQRLVAVGVRLALVGVADDPVALLLLHRLPVSLVKLSDGGVQERLTRLVGALVGPPREVDVDVVVERVEDPDRLELLRGVGDVLVQGYAVAHPRSPQELDPQSVHVPG